MAVSDLIADETIAHTINLMRFDAGERRSVLRLMRTLEDDLSFALLKSGITQFQKRRLNALQKLVEAIIESAYGQITDQMWADMQGLASAEGRQAVRAINDSVRVELASVYLAPATVREIAKNTLIEGAPSAIWWGRQSKALQRRFMDQVRMGLLQGQTIPQMSRAIRENVYPWNRRNADALVRTSVQSVANSVRLRTYEVNSSVVKGVQALVTLDSRTTRLCMSRSGMAWSLDGDPLPGTKTDIPFPGPPPWHWNCRTTLSAVLKSWDELGSSKKVREIDPGTRASMDGQVARDLTYEEWLKIKDAAEPGFAREKLGPGRYDLWKKGKLTLRDLVDQSGNELTLEQLLDKTRS